MSVRDGEPKTLLEFQPAQLQSWLEAIDTADRPAAELLLDSVEFVSRTRFAEWIAGVIRGIAETSTGPVSVFAVREIDTGGELFPADTKERPLASPGSEVGSEGMVSHLLRSLARGDERIVQHPSLDQMRELRSGTIVFVDDLVGTGDTVCNYIAAWYLNPTIRSWISRHRLQIHVVAYSMLAGGEQAILKSCSPGRVPCPLYAHLDQGTPRLSRHLKRRYPPIRPRLHFVSAGTGTPRGATRSIAARLRALCRTYGERWGIPRKWRLGYLESMALISFEHGCPNNAPGLLWFQSKRGPSPLLPGRLPRNAGNLGTFVEDDLDPDKVLRRLQEGYVLDCLLKGVRHASAISRCTGLPPRIINRIIGELRHRGVVDAKRRATSGVQGIQIQQKPGCVVEGSCAYLPMRLRETSGAR